MASLLSSAGIAPGDRVALMLPNVPAFPVAFYGALGAGAIVVPMNPLLKGREIAYYLGDSGACAARLAFGGGRGRPGCRRLSGVPVLKVDEPDPQGCSPAWPRLPAVADAAADDDAVILYTSGTTGVPRAPSSRTRPDPQRLGHGPEPAERGP